MTSSQTTDQLVARARTGKAWLFEHALPLWWERGFDRETRLFHESLDHTGNPISEPRRVRVQARQTIAYARAGRMGWSGPWRDAVEAGVEALLTRCLRADGGAYHVLAADGAPLDPRCDLYDLAFIILALTEASTVRADLIARADDIVAWIDANWSHPLGGFAEGDAAPTPPRRQNPHMHLLEALQALYAVSGEHAHLARAERLVALFDTRFVDHSTGAVREYFDASWQAHAGDAQALEPGHQFEWAWLLHRQRDLGGADLVTAAEGLRRFAEARGVDPQTNAIFDVLNVDGSPRARTSRLWPHTERVKANAATFARARDAQAGEAAVAAFDTLMRYCQTPMRGLWRDKMTPDGGFADGPAPASSFYHIIMAHYELARAVGAIDPAAAAD